METISGQTNNSYFATKSAEKPSRRWRATEMLPVKQWQVQQWQESDMTEISDPVVIEEPFEIRINGRSLAAIMRTPGSGLESDRELAMGFLLTEGIVTDLSNVKAIVRAVDDDSLPLENVVDVRLANPPANLFGDSATAANDGRFERRFTVASSCGICGKNSLVEVCRRLPALKHDLLKISAGAIYSLPSTLRAAQDIFECTGGLHAAGLFDKNGELLLLREDVGRHNAVDKLVGRMALEDQFPLNEKLLLVSGRTSFEIVQKALAARIPVIAAVSAPSSLALELAEESGITLIGFLRNQKMNVYTHAYRVC
ncbi:MAG TPA: formate dehydrogenase accessory sulfurtransferase FdhD [Chloroflexia bacterium]|nr:formate dehydrogenase accessory sulfurtransferase FdhD [Chloroflexia bacterium]